ncbi:MAG: hypothetical protein Q9165_007006 [Trypethelium subeluteriae]
MKYLTSLILVSSMLAPRSWAETHTVKFVCSDSRLEEICKDDCWGAYCLNKGTTFTEASKETADNNRKSTNKAPGASKQCGKDGIWSGGDKSENSIEEYPFASTKEGGPDAALRCVPSKGQSVQGGKLPKKANEGDIIQVEFTEYDKLGVDWCNPAGGKDAQCVDDGRQFYYDGKEFVADNRGKPYKATKMARRAIDEALNATVVASNATDGSETIVIGVSNYGRGG